MNRLRAKELLPIITAFANGEDIEVQQYDKSWNPLNIENAKFDGGYGYRIRPKPREWWIWNAPDGELLCRAVLPNENMNRDAIKVREVL